MSKISLKFPRGQWVKMALFPFSDGIYSSTCFLFVTKHGIIFLIVMHIAFNSQCPEFCCFRKKGICVYIVCYCLFIYAKTLQIIEVHTHGWQVYHFISISIMAGDALGMCQGISRHGSDLLCTEYCMPLQGSFCKCAKLSPISWPHTQNDPYIACRVKMN